MSPFQIAYNWIRRWTYPAWIKPYIQELNDVLIDILVKAGKDYIKFLEEKIVEAANQPTSSGDKFRYVFSEARKSGIRALVNLKESELNALIEYLVVMLKKSRI